MNIQGKIRKAVKNLILDLGYDVIEEQRSTDLSSGKVRVYFERQTDEDTHRTRNYIIITLGIDRMLRDKERADLSGEFFYAVDRALTVYRRNDIPVEQIWSAGTMFVDINERIEGYKVSYSFVSKI